MNHLKIISRFLVVLCMLSPLYTLAQGTKSIYFPSGKNSTYVTGTIKGHDYLDYKLNVLSGQTLSVKLSSKTTSAFFNVLPPGSNDVAIYNSSGEGNSFKRVADQSGTYTIRVYLMGAAKSEGRTANFGLTVGLQKPASGSGSAPRKYTATGQVRSSKGSLPAGSVMSDFGVNRTGYNKADVYITYPGSTQRILRYDNGKWTCLSSNCSVTYSKKGDDWHVAVNGTYYFIIPEAVVLGG